MKDEDRELRMEDCGDRSASLVQLFLSSLYFASSILLATAYHGPYFFIHFRQGTRPRFAADADAASALA